MGIPEDGPAHSDQVGRAFLQKCPGLGQGGDSTGQKDRDPHRLPMAWTRGIFTTCCQWVSGDAPVHIPELKRETFAKAHEQWYNAANALIVPDGTLDPDAALVLLDEALPAGQRQPTPPPPLQVPVYGGTTVVD